MGNRYVVHGTDQTTGQRVQKTIEAASAAEAEAVAARLGVSVLGSEVASSPAASASGPHPTPGVLGGTAPPAADPGPEEVIWSGTPSLWTNFWWYVACVLIVPIPWAIYKHLQVKNTRYTLSNQRLKLETGIIAKKVEEVELYRVIDTAANQSVLERLLGVGTVNVVTNDQRNPNVLLRWVQGPRDLREKIRQLGEARRRWRRVAEVEVQ